MLGCPPPPAWIIVMRAAGLRPDIPYLWLDRCPERVGYWHSSETSGVGCIDVETPHFLHDHAARQPRSCFFFHIGIFLHHMKHSMNCPYLFKSGTSIQLSPYHALPTSTATTDLERRQGHGSRGMGQWLRQRSLSPPLPKTLDCCFLASSKNIFGGTKQSKPINAW